MHALHIRNLCYSFRQNGAVNKLYDSFTLSIEHGKVTALMGASGSGKSTLGKILGGELQAEGIEWSAEFSAERDRFYVDQDPKRVLFPHQTVRENLRYVFDRIGKQGSSQAIDKLLHQFGLEKRATSYPKDLSGGERSRLALARILAWEPKAVILDECLSGLDMNTKEIILKCLEDRAVTGEFTIIFITHTVHEVMRLANRCIILGDTPVAVIHDLEIPLALPRNDTSPKYVEIQDQLMSLLRNQL